MLGDKQQIEPPRFYCPYCGLELSGNGHKSENQAWGLFNCEYSRSSDEKQPVPELEVQERHLARLRESKRTTGIAIKSVVARIHELETMNQEREIR